MPSESHMLAEIDRLESQNKRLREKDKHAVTQVVDTVAVLGGGAVAGFLDGKYPDKKMFGFGLPMAAGAALTLTGYMNWAGKEYSQMAQCLGEGILAYEMGKLARDRTSKSSSSTSTSGVGAKPLSRAELDAAFARMARAA